MKNKVFITGISGSVGHYLFDLLAGDPGYELYLLLRNPQKLKRDLSKYPNVHVINDDLKTVYKQKELLRQMDYAVLIATSWGGFKDPWRTNVYATCRIMRALDQNKLKKIIYFSTASILDREHKSVESIREIGTNYIRSKFLMHKMLPKQRNYDKTITVFPTWVYGGDATHPYSHAATGLPGVKKNIWLYKFFDFDFRFHFIHCQDIAYLTKYLMENKTDKNEYVLGNKAYSVGEFLNEAAQVYGQKVPFQIRISLGLVKFLTWLRKGHSWDQYCLKYKYFVYNTFNCQKVGLKSEHDTVAGLFNGI